MSHTGAIRKHKQIDDYSCDGSGPRPPVPGRESRYSKMTESSGCGDRKPSGAMSIASTAATTELNWERVESWKEGIEHMLCDQTAVQLLKRFVETEGGQCRAMHYINFYFLCEGLLEHTDEKKIRKIFAKCYEKYKTSIPHIDRLERMVHKTVPVDMNVLKELQQEVVERMSNSIYHSFFQSETFRDYYESFRRGDLATAPITIDRSQLMRNASLATVSEDGEFADKAAPKLTEKMLMLTAHARCNVGVGAQGYNIPFSASYNPVTRQSSEKMSCSSGHKSDQSLVMHKDGHPQKRCDSLESLRQRYPINMVQSTAEDRFMSRLPNTSGGMMPRRYQGPREFQYTVDPNLLRHELEKLETMEEFRVKLGNMCNNNPAQQAPSRGHSLDDPMFIQKLSALQDSDQDILDQHVSRVFSPQLSPMVPSSPGQPLPRRQAPLPPNNHNSRLTQSMKHSKSMPVDQKTSRKNSNMYGSHNFDSGISMLSADGVIKDRIDDEELRRPARQPSHPHTRPLPRITEQTALSAITAVYTYYDGQLEKEVYKTKIVAATPTLKSFKDLMPKKGSQFKRFFFKTVYEGGSILEELFNDTDKLPLFEGKIMGVVTTNALPCPNEPGNDFTVALYTYVNETSYRTRIPGRNITLRQFIDYLPRAGNFRFFFKTVCEDIDGPIHEEIVNDLDILPFYEGIIMGKVDPE